MITPEHLEELHNRGHDIVLTGQCLRCGVYFMEGWGQVHLLRVAWGSPMIPPSTLIFWNTVTVKWEGDNHLTCAECVIKSVLE